jgi:hypothetical protein
MILFDVLAKENYDRLRLIISEFSCEFAKIVCTILYIYIYHSYVRLVRVLRKMDSENINWCAQFAENRFGFDFFRVKPRR